MGLLFGHSWNALVSNCNMFAFAIRNIDCQIFLSIIVGEETVSSIGQGLCVLIGIGRYDTAKELEYM